MYIDDLMDNKSEYRCGSLGSFPRTGGLVVNVLFNFFEGSNEEILRRQQKEEVLW